MRHFQPLLISAAAALLAACATVPAQSAHTATVMIGKVEYKALLPAKERTDMGIYRPGMGGALGGLAAGIIAGIPVEGERSTYDIRSQEEPSRKINVYSQLVFEIGQCVEVLSTADRTGQEWFSLDQVTLRPSSKCR